MRNIIDIINRLKIKFALKNDSQIAQLLGVEQNTLSSWKKRNKIPYEKLDYLARENNLSLEWILSGESSHCNEYDDLIKNLNTLSEEKREVYILRIKADAIEAKTKSN